MKKQFGAFWVEAIAYQNDQAAFTHLLACKRHAGSLINSTVSSAMMP